jgi:hypothetical protein
VGHVSGERQLEMEALGLRSVDALRVARSGADGPVTPAVIKNMKKEFEDAKELDGCQ